MDFSHLKYLVVGSGFFGTTIAERIARDLGERVVIIEKRNHIGGNSFTSKDSDTGIECHHYGTHVFHTSNECVWQYIKNFSEFNNYRHRVLSKFGDKTYPIPVNLNTINTFYQENFNTDQAVAFMEKKQAEENYENPVSLEQKAISQMGRDLYEALIRGYSLKQWGKDPSALPPEIMNRIPIRFNKENQYFEDDWQGIPIEGFGQLIQSMLHHPNIQVYLNTDFFNIQELVPDDCLIFFSGPIDRFFHYQYGRLEWRSLTFEKKLMNIPDYQGIAVMNYAKASVLYTRIHEFKHLTPEKPKSNQTMIALEYPKDCTAFDDPFYPINTPSNQKVYEKYVEASRLKNQVIFGGRLGSYSYLNMDRAVEMALHIYQTKVRGIQ